jgi:hypothetical protein
VQPTLDDVFVEKTGRHLEGSEEQDEADQPEPTEEQPAPTARG